MTSHTTTTPNGNKHVRSHSLKSFPAVAAAARAAATATAAVDNNYYKKPGDGAAAAAAASASAAVATAATATVTVTATTTTTTTTTTTAVANDRELQMINSSAKMSSTWKQACDRTRDRTKQLLRRTMSWKSNTAIMQPEEPKIDDTSSTWEIHVWASWMKRYASEDESKTLDIPFKLSPLQEEKLLTFFKYYLDGDCDGFIFEHDFHQFFEKLRRFADWSPDSDEYIIMKQVLRELTQVFIQCESGQNVAFISLSTDDWLKIWCQTLSKCTTASDMPLWLKYFQNILFKCLDSGKGEIEKSNLQRFYCTFLGSSCEESKQEVIDVMYNSLTSNGDFKLDRDTWGQCFANWLLGTKPNGSGQSLFGKCGPTPEFFPIDYSAMNSTVDTRDTYSHKRRSDRHSIVV